MVTDKLKELRLVSKPEFNERIVKLYIQKAAKQPKDSYPVLIDFLERTVSVEFVNQAA